MTGAEVVRRYMEALNQRDLPGMFTLLDPEVKFTTARGPRRGRAEVERWLGEPYAELDVTRDIDRLQVAGPFVVATGRTRFTWRESGDLADESDKAWLFEVHDGVIVRWQAFDDEATALAAAGLAT